MKIFYLCVIIFPLNEKAYLYEKRISLVQLQINVLLLIQSISNLDI